MPVSSIPIADDVLAADMTLLTLAEVAARLTLPISRVRQMLRDNELIAVRRDGDFFVPADFFTEDAVVKGLPGTIIVLTDAGFSRTEMLRWLFSADETLPGVTPINALRTHHGTEVKRRAQALAL